MIQNYTIGDRPISFTANREDLIEVNEKLKMLVFVAILVIEANDTIETAEENNFNLNNSYSTAVKIEVPYQDVLMTDPNSSSLEQIGLLNYIERELKANAPFNIKFKCKVLKETSSKIVCKDTKIITR